MVCKPCSKGDHEKCPHYYKEKRGGHLKPCACWGWRHNLKAGLEAEKMVRKYLSSGI